MKFIVGKKVSMTQVFREDGTVVPVTRVQAGPCVVTQVNTKEKNGVDSVQLGYADQKMFRVNKAQQGHLKGLEKDGNLPRFSKEFTTDGSDTGLKRGDVFSVSIFEPGEKVKVTGKSKGRGFQGVVKRHGFSGSPASHGHKDQLRMPGSIGATGPARVFKGTRMGGHMGDATVSVTNLEIVEVHPETNELLIKGAVPGARNGLLYITTPEGSIEITKEAAPQAEAEEVKEETTETPEVAEEVVEEKKEEPAEKVEAPTEEKKEETKEEAPKEESTEEKTS